MKKILSVILILMYLLSLSASAQSEMVSDIQKEDLYNLGIMIGDENGDLRLEDNITRAEAVKMLCVAGNFELPVSANESIFNDVSVNHWAYKYIYSSKNNKIINGDGMGNFNPDQNITNEEIIKMLVCLLGYSEMAEAKGGYPAGYTAVASQYGITNGLKLRANTPALRNDVAIMISNALDIPVMVIRMEDGNAVYSLADGKNGNPLVTLRGKR